MHIGHTINTNHFFLSKISLHTGPKVNTQHYYWSYISLNSITASVLNTAHCKKYVLHNSKSLLYILRVPVLTAHYTQKTMLSFYCAQKKIPTANSTLHTVHNSQCTVQAFHLTFNMSHWPLHTAHRNSAYFSLHTTHLTYCLLHSAHRTHCKWCATSFQFHTLHCSLHTSHTTQFIAHTVNSIQYTLHNTNFSVHMFIC